MDMKLCSPWVNFYHEISALFEKDKDVNVLYDEENNVIKVYVDGNDKADALTKLLPQEKEFGGTTVYINVIPNNNEKTGVDLFKAAFDGNDAVYNICSVDTPFGKMNYVVFEPEVVQYTNDDLSDLHGLRSTLYQDIADDVFNTNLAFFCTKPMNEWEF